MDKNYAVVNISSYCRAGGQLTVADIKLETLTIDDKAPVLDVVAPKREDDDDGAMSDEEKQAILEDENITQVCFTCQRKNITNFKPVFGQAINFLQLFTLTPWQRTSRTHPILHESDKCLLSRDATFTSITYQYQFLHPWMKRIFK